MLWMNRQVDIECLTVTCTFKTYKLQTKIMSQRGWECNTPRLKFVFSVVACTCTTQNEQYESHHATINTDFPRVPKLRIIFLGLFQHCCHYLQNQFIGQPYLLDWKIMNLHLLWCLWLTLICVLENKIFVRNTCPGNHTNGCVGGHRTEILQKQKYDQNETFILWSSCFDTMYSGRCTPTLWKKFLPPSS
jgi:hypothetical protein